MRLDHFPPLTLRQLTLSFIAGGYTLALSACVAAPSTPSSSDTTVSSQVSSNNSVVSSSSSAISSLAMESSSSQLTSSSLPVASSSTMAETSSSQAASSVDAGPPMVSCELIATTNNGNSLDIEAFTIINSDVRPVDSWTITLNFGSGNINGYNNKVYADAEQTIELGSVNREGNGLILSIEGGMVPAMSLQEIHGFSINPAGIAGVPECELKVKVEGYDDSFGGEGFIGVPQEELDMHFANYPCGVNYTALGNGGWPACFRTEDGQAICKNGTSLFTLNWSNDKTPINDVMQVTGMGSDLALVITVDGAAYKAKIDIGVDPEKDQIVAAGAITASAGFTPRGCIMIDAGDKRDLLCTDKGDKWERPALPEDFDVVQLSASYKMNCALNTKGEAWCWGHPDAIRDIITDTPSRMPFNEPLVNISADQSTVCGVSYSGNPKCLLDQFVPGYVKTGDPIPDSNSCLYLARDFEPNAMFFHGAYNRGVVVRKDGTGAYYTKSLADAGTPIELDIADIIAAGGKRDQISVMTASGDIFSINGGSTNKVAGFKAQNPVCPLP